MVAVTHSLDASTTEAEQLALLTHGLESGGELIADCLQFIEEAYAGRQLGTGESVWEHAMGTALITASLKLDLETRLAALLFALCSCREDALELVEGRYGPRVCHLVHGLEKLNGLRVVTRVTANSAAPEIRTQTESLRKMVLAMVEDIRVVLLRLASRTQTLRYLTDHPGLLRESMARESLDIYAPLANRLGIWQLKWELEDLSFRFLEPETYKRIARQLDERRLEREQFIEDAMSRLRHEIEAVGIQAEIFGRPKHIYSIWNKMRKKRLDFSQIYDVRALRVLVNEVRDCYTILGLVHQMWTPIPKEFDDYISQPKGNNYQSLHTAVLAGDGRALEVQIRTHEMHRHAELGIAAHWRYKEDVGAGGSEYDDKIALLRSLLSWRDEITDSADWIEQFRRVSFDDTIYVLTPQGRVLDLPREATPVDFAYRLHTELGHRCRGARVNGQLVPLNTKLENGQCVEIIAAKQGTPSRDWLNPQLGYLASPRARQKVKQYFSALDEAELANQGRQLVQKELAREGLSSANMEELARRLSFSDADALYVGVGRGEITLRAILTSLRGESEPAVVEPEMVVNEARGGTDSGDRVLIVGVGKLMTTLARCCKPAPPDPIEGFVTRGRGVSIHRADCRDFRLLAHRHPERVVSAQWGSEGGARAGGQRPFLYPVDIRVEALDRQGLLRDISDVLAREKLNVIGVNTQSRNGRAFMRFTLEVSSIQQMQRAINLMGDIQGVLNAARG